MRLPPLYGAAIFQDTCVALIKKVRVGGVEPTLDSGTHSRMEHYFFSYLLNCEVDLFENSANVAIKSDIVTFIHVRSIKVTSGFNLRRMKKILQRALTCKKIKNKS